MTDREFTKAVVFATVWWIIGVAGFTYWWTTEYVVTAKVVIIGCIMGLMGPLAWLAGAAIHGGG